jgi:hypothetical protein
MKLIFQIGLGIVLGRMMCVFITVMIKRVNQKLLERIKKIDTVDELRELANKIQSEEKRSAIAKYLMELNRTEQEYEQSRVRINQILSEQSKEGIK